MDDLDGDGVLTTATGKKISQLKTPPSLFLDRSLVIYGPSGTGKTAIAKHIMKVLNGHIDQILIIAPTEASNQSYKGFVDPLLIHYRLFLADPSDPKKDDGVRGANRFLEAVWNRQEMMAAISVRANRVEVLATLFSRLPREVRAEGLKHVELINTKRGRVIASVRAQYGAEPGRYEEKVKGVNDKFRQMLALIYKKYIVPHHAALLARDDLTEDELYSLTYLQFNPRLLLIFDDCAAQLKPFFNKEIFRKLFYQNRHSFITIVVCCQDDTDLPTNLRKNAFISFFTEGIVCTSNFDRTSNRFPKPTKQLVADLAGDVFRGNRKLAYIREDERRQHFYHIQVPWPRPFRFESSAVHELCEAVRSKGVTMDKDNPFYDAFRL